MKKRVFATLCLAAGLGLALSATALAARETTLQLVAVLESDASMQEKAIACRKLGEWGTAEAVPALADLLQHAVLATYARQGLERIPGPEAPAALRAALETTGGELQIGVINSLGALRDEAAVPALVRLAESDDGDIVGAALLALGRVANEDAVRAIEASLASGQKRAASAGLLAAERRLSLSDTEGAISLYDTVASADIPDATRRGAIRGAIIARGSVPFLMEQLASDEPVVRAVALEAIREMPSSDLADALHARLGSADPDLKVQVLTALKDCHNPASFEVVRSALTSEDPAIRRAALDVVTFVGRGPALATTLLDVVQERPSPYDRQTAMGLLTRMEGGETVDRVMLERLQTTAAPNVRIDVMSVLGDRQAPIAVPELLEQSRDPNVQVRVAALRSMRRLVGPEEVPALIARVAAEEDGPARLAAISALVSACGDDGPSGELVLARLEQSRDASERDAWTRALTATGYPKALPVILQQLESPDTAVVASTVTALSSWPDPAPIEALFSLAESTPDPDIRRRAVTSVIQLTTTAADHQQRPDDVLAGWFGRADARVETVEEKRLLISGLARVHTVESLELLGPYLKDPEVEIEGLYALLSIGSPLVRAGQYEAVKKALPPESFQHEDLGWQIGRLRRQVEAAESPQ